MCWHYFFAQLWSFLYKQFEKIPSLSAFLSVIKEWFQAWRLRRNERRGGQSLAPELPAKQSSELDEDFDDVEIPSLLGVRAAVSSVKVDKKTPKAVGKPQVSQPIEPEPVRPEPRSCQPQPPDRATEITIIAEAAVEKSLGSIPERRGDYVFPPLELLSEALIIAS